VIQKDQIAN